MKVKITFSVVLILLVATQVFSQSKDEQVFRPLVKQLTDAQINYDAAALDRLFTADYIEISPAGEFDPRDKVLGFYKPELKPPAGKSAVEVTADEFSIRNYGKLAVVIVRLNYSISVDGKPLPPRSIRASYVMRKEKGSWKMASAQYTGIRPPAPPQKTN